jgi:hypothetical protein
VLDEIAESALCCETICSASSRWPYNDHAGKRADGMRFGHDQDYLELNKRFLNKSVVECRQTF